MLSRLLTLLGGAGLPPPAPPELPVIQPAEITPGQSIITPRGVVVPVPPGTRFCNWTALDIIQTLSEIEAL